MPKRTVDRLKFHTGRQPGRRMKAVRVEKFGGPDELHLVDLPDPRPAADQVLIRLHAAGVNPVETYIRSGRYAKLPGLPYIPGSEGAGVVEAVGGNIRRIRPGDRVFLAGCVTGTYAELALCTPDQVFSLPKEADFFQGASLGVAAATAWRGVFLRGGVRSGETVLVHGASGGVGTAAVQLARSARARVFGTAGSEAGLALVRAAGAGRVFHHAAPDYRQAILDATGGRGVDCILEMLANVNLGEDLKLLAPRGRVVIIGSRGTVEINPRDLMMREADIRGLIGGLATPDERAATFAGLQEALADGRLRPLIGRRFALSQAADAHRAVMEPKASGKILLIP